MPGSAEIQRRVSATVDGACMCRRQREFDELRALCSAGRVARAIDLAFEHFAHFGRDDEIVDLLARTIEESGVAGHAGQRFAELCSTHV